MQSTKKKCDSSKDSSTCEKPKHPYLSGSTINVGCNCMEHGRVDKNKINTISVTVEVTNLHILPHPPTTK